MRVLGLIAILCWGLPASLAHAQSEGEMVKAIQISPDTWDMEIRLPRAFRPDDKKKIVDPHALELCGNRTVRYKEGNNFGTNTGGGDGYTIYHVVFRCGGEPDPGPPGSEITGDWRPTSGDDDAVRRQSRDFLQAVSEGAYNKAFGMTEPLAKIDRPSLTDFFNRLRDMAGPLLRVDVLSLDWEANPPLWPYLGAYGTVRFRAVFARAPTVCGQIIWYRHGPSDYRLLRLDISTPPPSPNGSQSADGLPQPCK